jgi:hypothetical protein
MSVNEIIASMLELPIDERVVITDILTQSINPINKEIEQHWIDEVNYRLQLLDIGELETISFKDFFDEN